MGAGKGGDGGGADAAAATEAPQPVVLKMDLHCAGCADKVKKSIKRMPGTFDSFVCVWGFHLRLLGSSSNSRRISSLLSQAWCP